MNNFSLREAIKVEMIRNEWKFPFRTLILPPRLNGNSFFIFLTWRLPSCSPAPRCTAAQGQASPACSPWQTRGGSSGLTATRWTLRTQAASPRQGHEIVSLQWQKQKNLFIREAVKIEKEEKVWNFSHFFTGGVEVIFTLFILSLEWPNLSINARKHFYYYVNYHTLGGGGVKSQSVKFFLLFLLWRLP